MTPVERESILELGRVALWAAIAEDWPRAQDATQEIGDRFGGDGVMVAALAWIDTTLMRVPGLGYAADQGRAVALAFREETSGRFELADEVPPGVAWAGRLLAARSADDRDAFEALVNSVESDEQFGRYISDLLVMLATNLRPVAEAAQQVRASRGGEGR